jgi:hypothetical protein
MLHLTLQGENDYEMRQFMYFAIGSIHRQSSGCAGRTEHGTSGRCSISIADWENAGAVQVRRRVC